MFSLAVTNIIIVIFFFLCLLICLNLAVQYAFKNSIIHKHCNSYYLSHFAVFFIITRTKISIHQIHLALPCYDFSFL
ncbi:hypothetical protein M0811_14355 [Anaeramoeba ignava]|uniref:Uncharacterized protein n=1 Tax=Anaeramoeba ignava TaxID=1746090 RepID=A0A9Q0RGV7_ANAIG|nr:hypothetical protein M0811_14359 [Anaeramoeba ignava]KAJ5079634.1 hypothetical protein M0811_14355 [Anaeramoeba ignava]